MSVFRSNNKRFRGGGGACALEDWKAQKLKTAKRVGIPPARALGLLAPENDDSRRRDP